MRMDTFLYPPLGTHHCLTVSTASLPPHSRRSVILYPPSDQDNPKPLLCIAQDHRKDLPPHSPSLTGVLYAQGLDPKPPVSYSNP